MEEDIEKALNNLWNSLDDEFFNLTYGQEQMQEDIRLILNRYNYLDSKVENLINKNKGLEEISREYDDLIKLYAEALNTCEELEKMVEIMSKTMHYICLFNSQSKYVIGKYCKIYNSENIGECEDSICSECVANYFRKKAKGE